MLGGEFMGYQTINTNANHANQCVINTNANNANQYVTTQLTAQQLIDEYMQVGTSKKETFFAVGVGSRHPDNRHVLFLDLDDRTKDECELLAIELISKVGTSDCYIVQSSPGNHHLVSLDLVSFKKAHEIAKLFGHYAWARFRSMHKDFVIRVAPKLLYRGDKLIAVKETEPRLVSIVKSPFNYYEKSNSLRLLFSNLWRHPIKKDGMFIDDNRVKLHIYKISMIDEYPN